MTTIVLADDHALIRTGLRTVLDMEPNWAVVGEASDGREALALVGQLRPDILIVDLMLPGLSGLEVIRQARERVAKLQAVVLSMHANESYVLAALRNGAAAYVLKDTSSTTIIQAIHEVIAGRRYLSPPLSQYATREKTQSKLANVSFAGQRSAPFGFAVRHLELFGRRRLGVRDRAQARLRDQRGDAGNTAGEEKATPFQRSLWIHGGAPESCAKGSGCCTRRRQCGTKPYTASEACSRPIVFRSRRSHRRPRRQTTLDHGSTGFTDSDTRGITQIHAP